ncbi:MAG: hypothetical protein JNM68_17305, partial [Dinghuibacter sp.]|nr:hypothetical protein [Dinghuibacter sp.]
MDHINQKLAKEYWRKKASGALHVDEHMKANDTVDVLRINGNDLAYFYQLTGKQIIAEFTVLMALYNMLLQRYVETCFMLSSKMPALPGNKLLLYEFPAITQKTIKDFLQEAKKEVQEVYKYAEYYDSEVAEPATAPRLLFRFGYGKTQEEPNIGLFFNIEKTGNNDLEISIVYSEQFIQR